MPKTAINIMICLLSAVVIFHLCILVGLIPYEITWGGRLENHSQMLVFESISITIVLLLIGILLMKGNRIKRLLPIKLINVILWFLFGLFGLNTIGNLFAKTMLEKSFSILTLGAALLLWIILTKGNKEISSES